MSPECYGDRTTLTNVAAVGAPRGAGRGRRAAEVVPEARGASEVNMEIIK